MAQHHLIKGYNYSTCGETQPHTVPSSRRGGRTVTSDALPSRSSSSYLGKRGVVSSISAFSGRRPRRRMEVQAFSRRCAMRLRKVGRASSSSTASIGATGVRVVPCIAFACGLVGDPGGAVTSARQVGHCMSARSVISHGRAHKLAPLEKPLVAFGLVKYMPAWKYADHIAPFEHVHADRTLVFRVISLALPSRLPVLARRRWLHLQGTKLIVDFSAFSRWGGHISWRDRWRGRQLDVPSDERSVRG